MDSTCFTGYNVTVDEKIKKIKNITVIEDVMKKRLLFRKGIHFRKHRHKKGIIDLFAEKKEDHILKKLGKKSTNRK